MKEKPAFGQNNQNMPLTLEFPPKGVNIYKNEHLKTYFTSKLANRSISHAYILEGPPGSGKHTFALAVAASLADKSAAKVLSGNCPDVIIYGLSGDRKTIGIETVRMIKESAYIMPNELDFKLYIIEDAHLLTTQAQNGLLKLLEEPPASVYFMLLCEDSTALLATVRSRAPILKMQIFSDDEISQYLTANIKKAQALSKNNPKHFERIVKNAAGSIGAAISAPNSKAANGEKTDKSRDLVIKLIKMMSSGDRASFVSTSSEMQNKREELVSLTALLLDAFRDMAIYKKHPDCRLLFFEDAEEVSNHARFFTLAQLSAVCGEITRLYEWLELNINIATAQILILDRLWQIKHGQLRSLS